MAANKIIGAVLQGVGQGIESGVAERDREDKKQQAIQDEHREAMKAKREGRETDAKTAGAALENSAGESFASSMASGGMDEGGGFKPKEQTKAEANNTDIGSDKASGSEGAAVNSEAGGSSGFMSKLGGMMSNFSASDKRIKDYVFGAYGKYPHESSMNKVLKVKILQGLI